MTVKMINRPRWPALTAARALELLTAAGLLVGWLLVTVAVAQVARPRVVWPLSLGLLCCSLGGWQLLYTIARYGLYALHESKDNA